MKLGTKSNLISAYTALFTVAAGILLYDGWSRADRFAVQKMAAKEAASIEAVEPAPVATSHLATLR